VLNSPPSQDISRIRSSSCRLLLLLLLRCLLLALDLALS
jgi:hypothetical protein